MRSLLIAALLPALNGCADACQNTPLTSAVSPDGRHSAVLFQRDCGATSGFSTHISILAASDEPNSAGNIFIADDDHGAASVGEWGGSWAEMKWLAADHLLVNYAAKSRIFERADEVDGVRITYRVALR